MDFLLRWTTHSVSPSSACRPGLADTSLLLSVSGAEAPATVRAPQGLGARRRVLLCGLSEAWTKEESVCRAHTTSRIVNDQNQDTRRMGVFG
jgi:hypothetical protein